MTNEERWKIEGKARDDLRDARKNVAAIKAQLEEFATKLKEAAGSIEHFLEHSIGPGPTGMSAAQYTTNFFHTIIPADIQGKLTDFERESERLKKLEQRVGEFDKA